MLPKRPRGRRHNLVLWLARLALFAYAFQLTALDHWPADVSSVAGVEGSSAHSSRCHGSPSSCAEQPGLVGSLDGIDLTPRPPVAVRAESPPEVTAPGAAFIRAELHPPRFS
jgi:hypothetical protein